MTIALLSPRAQRLLLWIMFEVKSPNDFLWINVPRYMKENRIEDRKTYRAAVTELSRYMIIHRHPKYKTVFWLNSRFFFAGSRVNKYPKHVKTIDDEPIQTPAAKDEPAQAPPPVEQATEFRV